MNNIDRFEFVPDAEINPESWNSFQSSGFITSFINVSGFISTTLGGVPLLCTTPLTHGLHYTVVFEVLLICQDICL